MKKIFIVLISLSLALSLVGCGKKSAKSEKSNNAKVSSAAVEKEADE